MKTLATSIEGVAVVETTPILDHRGSFARLFCARDLELVMGSRRILQINHSRTAAVGAVRGMHYQGTPHAEMKLVRCVSGRVWDVAVDLREGSPTFLRWHGEELTPENMRMMVIPEGCAHGFQALAPDSELIYLHTACYEPEYEGGVRPDDPMLKIQWPLEITDVSSRDQNHPLVMAGFQGLRL